MNEQEQRIAIAEACGWREAFPSNQPPHPETKRGGILLPYRWVNENDGRRAMELPDFVNDLNAMREAEETLIGVDAIQYVDLLAMEATTDFGRSWLITHAKASQKAEAFLRTLNKWKE